MITARDLFIEIQDKKHNNLPLSLDNYKGLIENMISLQTLSEICTLGWVHITEHINLIVHICDDLGDTEHLHTLGESILNHYPKFSGCGTAEHIFRIIGEADLLRRTARVATENNDLYTAFRIYHSFNDREGMAEILRREYSITDFELNDYLGKTTVNKLLSSFRSWATERGFPNAPAFDAGNRVNQAYHLAKEYDLGVGVARSGLFPAYIFNLFGLETVIADSHRRGKGATFRWTDQISQEEIEGKRIAVFDKDVVSGRTSQRVCQEIKKFSPEKIDLILYWPQKERGGSTIVSSIPQGFSNVYYRDSFDCRDFDKAVEELEEKLK